MSNAAVDLVSLTEALSWLSQDQDDEVGSVERLVTAASTTIAQHIGYNPILASYNKNFNGNGGNVLFLPDRPVVSVSSVTVDNISVSARANASPASYGYAFDAKAVYLSGYWFCRGVQNVNVQYTAGYAATAVPVDLKQACLDLVKVIIENLPGYSDIRAGDTEIKFDGNLTKMGSVTVAIPPAVAGTLQSYRRVSQ